MTDHTAPDTFAQRVLRWFDQHGRKHLPWQQNQTPYRVWISEIMLQQTQVATVLDYYERFMARFPDVTTLAAAAQDEVLHLWTGLGYYSRARNLHRCAQTIVEHHQGHFPVDDLDAMCALPGIGRSTAGAIIALSTGQRATILDGNVKRVLTRYHAIEGWPAQPKIERQLWAKAEAHTPETRVGDYTQAMMDLGATLCTRRRPTCTCCPLQTDCAAYHQGCVDQLPTPKPKKTIPERSTCMPLVTLPDGHVLLKQRPAEGIWGGLWSLPEFESSVEMHHWLAWKWATAPAQALSPVSHTFTHFKLQIHPWLAPLNVTGHPKTGEGWRWYHPQKPDSIGLAAPVKKLLESLHQPQQLSLTESE